MANWRLHSDKTEKPAPVSDDILMIEDSADSYNVKYVKCDNIVSNVMPVGSIFDNASLTLSNSLLCDGRTIGDVGSGADVESSDYETLFEILKTRTDYGNAGTEVWADGDTVLLPNLVYDYGFMTMSSDQTPSATDDVVDFDTVEGGNLTFATTGQISLNPNKMYKLRAVLKTSHSTSGGTGQFKLYDDTANEYLSTSIIAQNVPVTYSSSDVASQSETAGTWLFTGTAKRISIRIFNVGNISSISSSRSFFELESCGITKENTFIRYK